jgi:hypothetical protein
MTTVQDQARPRTPTTFWIAWSIDLIAALILVYFFFVGLADGSVSSFNMALWLLLLGVAAVVVGGSLALRAASRVGLATMLVMVAAVPCTLLGLFFLVLITVPARWN